MRRAAMLILSLFVDLDLIFSIFIASFRIIKITSIAVVLLAFIRSAASPFLAFIIITTRLVVVVVLLVVGIGDLGDVRGLLGEPAFVLFITIFIFLL